MVTVGQLPIEITGFENDKCGNSNGQWRNNQVNGGTGSCEINEDLQYVRYGNKSLKINFNLADTTGTVGTQINSGSLLKIEGTPTAIGMWVYATPSAKGAWIRIQYQQTGSSGALYADFGHIDWEGWKYLEAPIEAGVKYPISVKYLIRIMAVAPAERIDGVIYVDQLRAVYGFSNDDFISPEISNITPEENGVASTTTQTISFDITDDKSGINKEKTEFYMDGKKIDNLLFKEINKGYSVSWTPSSLIPLNNGEHTFKVRIEDNYQNFATKEWKITVNSNAPTIEIQNDNEVEIDEINTITMKISNMLFKKVSFDIELNKNEINIESINGLNGVEVSSEVNEDKIKLTISNSNFIEEGKEIVEIKYKTLTTGEINIQFANGEIELSDSDSKISVSNKRISISSNSKPYDYTDFINNVNKINKDNVLKTLTELKAAYDEYENIKNHNITDETVLKAVQDLNESVEKYNQILEYIDSVYQSASKLDSLLGGR